MTKHWLILMIVLGTVLPAVAQMPSAPATSSAATNPPPAKSEAAVPSFGRDVGSVLHAVRSRLLSGWQRIAQAVDAFLQPPPASPVVEPLPTPPPAPGPPVAEPPPASVQVAQATPPAQSQPEPQPAPPPAPPAVVQTP
ncbi:MAG: hypothetical protein N2689_08545, partial [Verrucomicrobiae bacterium]|nr:hypothetical protein [Verrucomicrobiae bacterium]